MPKELIKFTVRINPETAKKLVYVADYYGRSQNRQIDWLCKQCVLEFEREHGKIELEGALE